jgi:non-specific serine/threonine protein kinase
LQQATPGQSARAPSPLRFGPAGRFELQPAERRLLVDGQPAVLGGRALDLLITLADQPDHLITKNELLDRVWPGLVVEEANLQMQISNLRKLLGGDVIATVPGRGYRFAAPVAEARAAPASATPAHREPLSSPAAPALPRLFGRDADLALLDELLQSGSCVTLVGTSGVGKTSLARAATARWAGRSVWVDLASLTQGDQLPGALGRALGVQLNDGEAAPQLLRALHGDALLLVLDNAEHLIQSCAEFVAFLRTVPEVRVLVTSQLPLAVADEHIQRLEPLAVQPATDAADLGDGALALLVERIVAADHRFRVAPGSLALLNAICAHLDGLPLALEMAAARVPLLGLQGVHDALAQRFALLTRGRRDAAARHRSLHDALDWSYRLLAEPDQRLFRALGVFAGGFTLDLAVALCTDQPESRWDIVDSLASLADRSLVAVSADDPPRYRLLETMRAFALEQLALAGEESEMRGRHAAAVLALFARHVPGDAKTLALCRPEMENARDAVDWARAHDLREAALLTARASVVGTFNEWRGEVTAWMQALEPQMLQEAGQALPADVQADWWTEFARMLTIRGHPQASAAARRAVALAATVQAPERSMRSAIVWVRSIPQPGAELDQACAELRERVAAAPDLHPRQRLMAHAAMVRAALVRCDYRALLAGRLSELALARDLGEKNMIETAESNVVSALNALGRYAEGAERGRALLARMDRPEEATNANLPWVFAGLLEALVCLKQLGEAQALARRAWAVCRRFDSVQVAPPLVLLAASRQRFEVAARLVGHTRQSNASNRLALEPTDERLLQEAHTAIVAALGTKRTEMLIQEGRALSDDAAAALAAGED